MLREDPAYADKAARIASLARDVTEIVEQLGLRTPAAESAGRGLRVAYHSACSMQHGQRLHGGPKALLTQAGFETRRGAGGASLLRLGRHLQSAAAGDRPEVARPQARQHRHDQPRSRRHRQYRLHHPARARLRRCRSCTRSSCSTGPPAARSRRHCAPAIRRGGGRGPGSAATARAPRRRSRSARPSRPPRSPAARRRRRDRRRRSSSAIGRQASQTHRRRAAAGVRPSP